MVIALPSKAEQQAAKASSYAAFAGLSLPSVRADLTELLGLIRSNGLFDEYTKHDITHIDRMLGILDWLIPDDTKAIMSSADWLLMVLAAYFHDLGMLVTKTEYENRSGTAFVEFKRRALENRDRATRDFKARIDELPPEEAERFLYQEYVRQNHAKRIKSWIEGQPSSELGITPQVAGEITRMLGPLGAVFRDDLATVCESHHLTDLDDTTKYPYSMPYGSTPDETANVQYIAVILRTIDLLDITADRAPSIAFRVISPRDPISQREWAKQRAVTNVRPKDALNSDGNVDKSRPKDTIEVHARFDDAEGYFGLTSYLSYAEAQLKLSHDWITVSNKKFETKHYFPWRSMDLSKIKAKGFIPEPFSFTLDQDRILELLTGHTLYNDSSVVVRELLQNSIDAVRLQWGDDAAEHGLVQLRWDSKARILEVQDNGTGMTQDMVKANFLNVGSSYYQSERFQEKYPEFHPISRFGIGVLSTFMVADQVEVTTSHVDEPKARRLELRTVHGQYLIRLLEKGKDAEAQAVGRHGTVVRLFIRPSADLDEVEKLARRWIVVPACKVSASIDGKPPVALGYHSAKEALEAEISASLKRPPGSPPADRIRVIELQDGGVSLAYAVQWSSFFQEWNFVSLPRQDRPLLMGTCVEGVRVENGTPGFIGERDGHILAIANIVGPGAPTTNVARSGFENSDEYEQCLRVLYALYAKHISDEINEMQSDRGHSLTWAISEVPYLVGSIYTPGRARSRIGLREAFGHIPILLMEEDGKREAISIEMLAQRDFFWTIDGALPSHIEYLLREIPEPVSLTGLLRNLGTSSVDVPEGPLLCTRPDTEVFVDIVAKQWQISELHANEKSRRCDAKWVKTSDAIAWSSLDSRVPDQSWGKVLDTVYDIMRRRFTVGGNVDQVRIPIRGVEISGFGSEYSAAIAGDTVYLLPGTDWTSAIKFEDGESLETLSPSHTGLQALGVLLATNEIPVKLFEDRVVPILGDSTIAEHVDLERFIALRKETNWKVYDTRRWQRWLSGASVNYFDDYDF